METTATPPSLTISDSPVPPALMSPENDPSMTSNGPRRSPIKGIKNDEQHAHWMQRRHVLMPGLESSDDNSTTKGQRRHFKNIQNEQPKFGAIKTFPQPPPPVQEFEAPIRFGKRPLVNRTHSSVCIGEWKPLTGASWNNEPKPIKPVTRPEFASHPELYAPGCSAWQHPGVEPSLPLPRDMAVFVESGVDDPRHFRSIVISRKVFPEKFSGNVKPISFQPDGEISFPPKHPHNRPVRPWFLQRPTRPYDAPPLDPMSPSSVKRAAHVAAASAAELASSMTTTYGSQFGGRPATAAAAIRTHAAPSPQMSTSSASPPTAMNTSAELEQSGSTSPEPIDFRSSPPLGLQLATVRAASAELVPASSMPIHSARRVPFGGYHPPVHGVPAAQPAELVHHKLHKPAPHVTLPIGAGVAAAAAGSSGHYVPTADQAFGSTAPFVPSTRPGSKVAQTESVKETLKPATPPVAMIRPSTTPKSLSIRPSTSSALSMSSLFTSSPTGTNLSSPFAAASNASNARPQSSTPTLPSRLTSTLGGHLPLTPAAASTRSPFFAHHDRQHHPPTQTPPAASKSPAYAYTPPPAVYAFGTHPSNTTQAISAQLAATKARVESTPLPTRVARVIEVPPVSQPFSALAHTVEVPASGFISPVFANQAAVTLRPSPPPLDKTVARITKSVHTHEIDLVSTLPEIPLGVSRH